MVRLHRRSALGIAALPATRHNTIDEILTELIQREESGVELYRELLSLVKDKSVVLEEYATRLVASEAVHLREMELMLMKRAPDQSVFILTKPGDPGPTTTQNRGNVGSRICSPTWAFGDDRKAWAVTPRQKHF